MTRRDPGGEGDHVRRLVGFIRSNRWRLAGATGSLVLVVAVGLSGLPRTVIESVTGVGATATSTTAVVATAEAISSTSGHPASALIDTPRPGAAGLGAQWQSASKTVGAYVRLVFAKPTTITSVQLFGSTLAGSTITAGTLSFSDSSTVPVGALPRDGIHSSIVAFPPKTVTSVRFTVSKTTGSGRVGIAEFGAWAKGTTPPKWAKAADAAPAVTQPTSSVAKGMTLDYAEEFTSMPKFSRTGADADYASSKPEWYGADEFGDAIFADPSSGLGNLAVVDKDYLKISVLPKPSTFEDPMKWNRTYIGGILSSASVGGSGFSAKYGYFEARMKVPTAPGTWPAFWMLPNTGVISAQPTGTEFDAVELYGHDPKGACQSTHEYADGADTGKVQCGDRFASTAAASGWHVYGAKLTPTQVIFYIDGAVVATAPQVKGGDKPMFFMANFALGGGWPIDLSSVGNSASMYVDYIRVYT